MLSRPRNGHCPGCKHVTRSKHCDKPTCPWFDCIRCFITFDPKGNSFRIRRYGGVL